MSSQYNRWKGTGTGESFDVPPDEWGPIPGDIVRRNLNALAAFAGRDGNLGGMRGLLTRSSTEVLVPEYRYVYIDWRHIQPGPDNPLTVRARVEVYTESASTGVIARIKNLTDGADYDFPTYSTADTWHEDVIDIPPPLVAAVKKYALYVLGVNTTNQVAALGSIEIFDPLF